MIMAKTVKKTQVNIDLCGLTKPSSGINPSVFCLGILPIVPRGLGIPVEVKQFKSFSFSLT
jgi:hypothetical protein